MRRRISEVPRPNPGRITNALRNGERITAEIIAKATEHLKMQLIPFWKAKYMFYHLLDITENMENPRGHNQRIYVLKPYTRD